MKLIDVAAKFATEDACLGYIEQMRWPMGVACLKCGSQEVRRLALKGKRGESRRICQCLERGCVRQFTATTGTIFHDTHLPLTKWFTAIAVICETKKGVSACQLQRHLGVSYRTAWYLAHRIREAMKEDGTPLVGAVEADETYLSPRKPRVGNPKPKNPNRDVVIGMIQLQGKLKLFAARDAKMSTIGPLIVKHVHPDSTLQTDESPVYSIIGMRRFPGRHRQINHTHRVYAIGDTHTQSIENAFSLLKRGVYGTFHKVSIKHLGRYCNEFSYRFNRRTEQAEMFDGTLKNVLDAKALPYKSLTASVVSEL